LYTKKYIYEQLPPGVLPELERRNPTRRSKSGKTYRSHARHQLLTDEVGDPHLEKQIVAVMTLMRASTDWKMFDYLFKRAIHDRWK